jgi:hypothetical protein
MRYRFRRLTFFSGVVLLTGVLRLGAITIYDNSKNDLTNRFEPLALEVGDEIVLDGTARYLTNFSFEFWGTNTANAFAFTGNVEGRVRFYLNDGPVYHGYRTPGTVFFDSDWFPISQTTERSLFVFRAGVDFPPAGLVVPVSPNTNMTWSVQFQGMAATHSVGVDLYSPPVIGDYFSDYWERTSGGAWLLKTNSAVPSMDFAARMEATFPPPSLNITMAAGKPVLFWPTNAPGFMLESSGSLEAGAPWTSLTDLIGIIGTNFVRTNDLDSGAVYYRLRKQ